MEKLIFPEQTLTFFEDTDGSWISVSYEDPFILEEGKSYEVIWDGVKYVTDSIAADTDENGTEDAVIIGKIFVIDPTLPANDFPFLIAVITADGITYYMMMGEPGVETHTVAIYEHTASGIILRDRNGDEQTYEGVTAIEVDTTDGGTQIFSKGEVVEKTMEQSEVDFSGGDIVVTPDENTLFSSVTIQIPESLKPENIAKDVVVAGITGTHDGGGGEAGLIDYVNQHTDTIDNHTYFGLDCFQSVTFTKAISIDTNSFYECNNLKIADFHILEDIKGPAFAKTMNLYTMIIRTATKCNLSNSATGSLFGTKLLSLDFRGPIALGTGYIYVPAALVDAYKTDTEWSRFADQFRAIEDYPEICG